MKLQVLCRTGCFQSSWLNASRLKSSISKPLIKDDRDGLYVKVRFK